MTIPSKQTIPHGFCHCGCGNKTLICTRSYPAQGYKAGDARKFLFNHHAKMPREDFRFDGNIVYVPLTQGLFATIDRADFAKVKPFLWYAVATMRGPKRQTFYARSTGPCGRPQFTSLHQFLMKPPAGMLVDHRNGDGLDNRRCNLRICDSSQNGRNRMAAWDRDGFKGVYRSSKKDKWVATLNLGTFNTREEAAAFYDRASLLVFPDFTRLNQPRSIRQCS